MDDGLKDSISAQPGPATDVVAAEETSASGVECVSATVARRCFSARRAASWRRAREGGMARGAGMAVEEVGEAAVTGLVDVVL